MKTRKLRFIHPFSLDGIGETIQPGEEREFGKKDAAALVWNGFADFADGLPPEPEFKSRLGLAPAHPRAEEKPPPGTQQMSRVCPECGAYLEGDRCPKCGHTPQLLGHTPVRRAPAEEIRLSKTSNGKPVIALEQEGLYLDVDYDYKEWSFAVRDFRDPLSPHTTYTVKLDTPQKLITSKFAKPIRETIKALYRDDQAALNRIIYLLQMYEYTFEPDLAPDQEEEEEPSPAEIIINLVTEHGLTFFRDQFTEPYTYLKTTQEQELRRYVLNSTIEKDLENSSFSENKQENKTDATDASPLVVIVGEKHNTRCVLNNDRNNNKGASVSSVGSDSIGSVWQVHRLRSRYVSDYLSGLFHQMTGKTIGRDQLHSAISVLAAKAQRSTKTQLWNRVAPDGEGGVWLDMSNDQWEAIHVTQDGWEIVNTPPILFRRYPHQNPMIQPTGGGNLASLLDFCNLGSVDDQLLFLVIAVHYLIPGFPHIGVCLWGTHGSVKSTQQRFVKSLIDPSSVGLLSMPGPNDIAELIQQLDHHYLPFYDNVTTINNDQSDTLCRAITGIGHQRRALYTDDDIYSRHFKRCVSLNGVNVPISNPDFLNRFVVLECPHLPEAYRRAEKELEAEFDERAPLILGAMLDTVVKAITLYPSVEEKVGAVPRMADATLWCCAIAEVLGVGWQSFLNAYRVNIGEVEESTVRSSPIGEPLLAFLEVVLRTQETVTVTATQLLTHLKQYAEAEGQNLKTGDFPSDGTRLSKELNKIKANLPKLGYHLRDSRASDGTRNKVFTRIKSTKLTEDYTPAQRNINVWRAEDLRHVLDPESYRRDGSRTRDGERALEISEPEWLPTRDMDVEQPADPGSSEGETTPEIRDSRNIPDIPESSEGETLGPDDVEESKPAQAVLGDIVEPDDPRMVEIVAYIAKNGGKYTADQIAYRWGGIPRPIFDRLLARAREVGLVYVDTEGRWFGR